MPSNRPAADIVFVVSGDPRPVFSYAQTPIAYARHAAALLAGENGLYRPHIVGFHTGPTERTSLDGVALTLLANDSAIAGPDSYLSRDLWGAIASASIVHVVQPAHATGALALVTARSLGKKIVAAALGGGGIGIMLFERGLTLADRILFPCETMRQGLSSWIGGGGTVLPPPVDPGRFAPLDLPRAGTVCADPLGDGAAARQLIDAQADHIPLLFCGPGQSPAQITALQTYAGAKQITFGEAADASALRAAFAAAAEAKSGYSAEQPQSLWLWEALACGTPGAPRPEAAMTLPRLYQQLLAEDGP